MKKSNYIKYFRVFQNDTVVTEVSTNDFRPLKLTPFQKDWLIGRTKNVLCSIASVKYALLANSTFFYGYSSRAKAMEMAKIGAMNYINNLIKQGEAGRETLAQYRFDHYQDLHVNLLEANIRLVREGAGDKQNTVNIIK
jgi:hypothetical protein